MTRVLPRACIVGVALAVAFVAPAGAHERDGDGGVKVVAKGLDNPRGLGVGADGALYVTESGRGGSGPCIVGDLGDQRCFGTTGALTRVDPWHGKQTRILSGLPSLAAPDGSQAMGPADVASESRSPAYLIIGLGADPAVRAKLPHKARAMAQLSRITRFGKVEPVADLGAFEAANDPDKSQPRSDPAAGTVASNPSQLATDHYGNAVVADSAGNDVLTIKDGKVSLLAVIPFLTIPADPVAAMAAHHPAQIVESVPTSVVRGPDGAFYVGQLTGEPFPEGAASVWRIKPGRPPQQYATGFTQITDLAFGRDGSLYVLEFAKKSMLAGPSPGALIRVKKNGKRQELAPGALQQATGLALDKDHAYVSTNGLGAPGAGKVLRVRLRGDD
jgi:hypothetical protein